MTMQRHPCDSHLGPRTWRKRRPTQSIVATPTARAARTCVSVFKSSAAVFPNPQAQVPNPSWWQRLGRVLAGSCQYVGSMLARGWQRVGRLPQGLLSTNVKAPHRLPSTRPRPGNQTPRFLPKHCQLFRDRGKLLCRFAQGEPYLRATFKGTTAELNKILVDHQAGKGKLPDPVKEEPGFGPEYQPENSGKK